MFRGKSTKERRIGSERCRCWDGCHEVLETEAMIILEQHRVKNGLIENITRAGDFHASVVNVKTVNI